jgi:predicted peptidase
MVTFRPDLNCLWFPPDADDEAGTGTDGGPPPLLVFLHGIGERGNGSDELTRVHAWGVTKYRAERTPITDGPFPFLVIAPQCPPDRQWSDPDVMAAVERMVDEQIDQGAADPRRLYLTGFSMGGIGVFSLALRAPGRFAAVAPVCGRCLDPPGLASLAPVPVWLAYAEDDEVRELALGSAAAAERLASFGNLEVRRFRLGAGGGMSAHVRTCDAAYADPGLYRWLSSRRASAR